MNKERSMKYQLLIHQKFGKDLLKSLDLFSVAKILGYRLIFKDQLNWLEEGQVTRDQAATAVVQPRK